TEGSGVGGHFDRRKECGMSDDKIKCGLWKKESNNGGAPYYGGKIEINGREYWVNLYKNDRKEADNHPDLNLILKPKEASAPRPARQTPPRDGFEDDEIGF